MDLENEQPLDMTEGETEVGAPEGSEVEVETETPEGEGLETLETEGGETLEASEGEDGGEEKFSPNLKFKAGIWDNDKKIVEQKEYEIDKRFQDIMKDPESEKLVRELHEKAYGIDAVKGRYQEARESLQSVMDENRDIKASIDGVRNIYQTAVRTGNLHKLDVFFEKLSIPQEVILKYALAKVELNEMTPEQRRDVEARLLAERRAEELSVAQETQREILSRQAQEMKHNLVDAVLERPAIAALSEAFDASRDKPGAFKEAVYREGQLAWATEGIDISPQEAVNRVIENYGLKNSTPGKQPVGGETPQNPGVTIGAEGKKIVRRTEKTIPNISGRSTSPLGGKMKSVDDLVKYRRENYGA